jgi:hypothetical protein
MGDDLAHGRTRRRRPSGAPQKAEITLISFCFFYFRASVKANYLPIAKTHRLKGSEERAERRQSGAAPCSATVGVNQCR